MKILREQDKATVKEIDRNLKNKWSWKWCSEVLTFLDEGEDNRTNDTGGRSRNYTLGECIVKIDVPGQTYCQWCQDKLSYKGNGKGNLLKHCQQEKHKAHARTRATNYRLGGLFNQPAGSDKVEKTTGKKSFFPLFMFKPKASGQPVHPHDDSSTKSVPLEAIVPLADRTANLEAMILAYMTENSLALSKSESLVKLIKECSRDPQALAGVALSKTTASYKIQYGLGKTVTKETVDMLKTRTFSISADESTTSHGKRVLAILVRYVNDDNVSLVEHLASTELEKVNSESIFNSIVSVIESNNISWSNLVSALFDSCNVMRGCKSGVEVRLKEKAPHLLDIDGDSCHHIHNVVKAFCKPFGSWLEDLYSDLHMDFKYCTQHKKLMSELCRLGLVKFTIPERFVSHRWLSAYGRALDTGRLLKVYVLFYWAYVPVHQQAVYRSFFELVLNDLPSAKAKQRALQIISLLSAKAKTQTPDGKARKARIISHLYEHQSKTIVLLNIYLSCLHLFKEYVQKFQKKDTSIHELLSEQEGLIRKFLACFVKSDTINGLETTALANFSPSNTCHLEDEEIFVGPAAGKILKETDDTKLRDETIKNLKQAYGDASTVLIKKLPLSNSALQAFKALSPTERPSQRQLKELIKQFSFIFSEAEMEAVQMEAVSFYVDRQLPVVKKGVDVVKWWSLNQASYPQLTRLANSAFSCFHGPDVESSCC